MPRLDDGSGLAQSNKTAKPAPQTEQLAADQFTIACAEGLTNAITQ
jgi:hypothetical protein